MSLRRLQDYVTHQAERRPEAVALVNGNHRITYLEIERRSNQLARLLLEGGCRPGDRVGLLLPKSATAIASMLAVLKAGGIYVPLDPESPPARVGKILGAADCRYVCMAASALPLLKDLLPKMSADVRPALIWMNESPRLDDELVPRFTLADADALDATPPMSQRSGEDAPAHLLFTSGSTGVPKGVVVTHGNVAAFVDWATAHFGLTESDRVSCHSPLHFDLSTFDLYGGFAAGAEVHLVPRALNLFAKGLIEFIRNHELTQWFSVPSVLTYLARFGAVAHGDFPALRRILWCGEVFPTPALIYWMERLPHVAFTNLYGPTETTIASSYYTVPAPPADANARVPIGTACGGEELLVLDEDLNTVPQGAVGEIHIAGAGVTGGYWRDEERTRAAFLARSGASAADGGRMYRTGDLGYRGADELVYFLGRADTQIKARGHRIELGEIEAALHSLPEVGQAAVVATEAEFGGYTICCAFAPREGVDLAPHALKQRLAALLPGYMLPVLWRRMSLLPVNANGKVDRVALAAMFRGEKEDEGDRAAGERA